MKRALLKLRVPRLGASLGFTLTEVMVSAGVLSIFSLMILALILNQSLGSRAASQSETFNQLVAIVQALIGNEPSCSRMFSRIFYGPGESGNGHIDSDAMHGPGEFLPSSSTSASGSNIPCLNMTGLLSPAHGGVPQGGCPPNPVHPAPYFDNANAKDVVVLADAQYKNLYISNINFTRLTTHSGTAFYAPPPLETPSNLIPPPAPYFTYIANISIHAQKAKRIAGSTSFMDKFLGANDFIHNFPIAITTQNNQIVSCDSRFPTSMTAPLCFSLKGIKFVRSKHQCIFY